MRYLTDIDMCQNEIRNAVFHPSSVEPTNPKVGQFYTDISSIPAKLMWYDGEKWVPMGEPTPVVPENYPTAIQPSVTIELSGAQVGNSEVGTLLSVQYVCTLDPGSYSYGPDTGVTATEWRIKDPTGSVISNEPSGTLDSVQVGDTTEYKLLVEVDHTAGSMPTTDQGNPYPAIQIIAGTKTTSTENIKGYRKYFFGTSPTVLELTSENIRSFTNSTEPVKSGTSFDLPIQAGTQQVLIAFPSDLGLTLESVIDTGAFGIDVYDIFEMTNVNVEGANGYEAVSYDVYSYLPEVSLSKNKYIVTIS